MPHQFGDRIGPAMVCSILEHTMTGRHRLNSQRPSDCSAEEKRCNADSRQNTDCKWRRQAGKSFVKRIQKEHRERRRGQKSAKPKKQYGQVHRLRCPHKAQASDEPQARLEQIELG
jgi:hypothetical protein